MNQQVEVHGIRSPSSCGRIVLCPGSVHIAAQYPETGPSSPAAVEGTHDHTLLERCLKNGNWDVDPMVGITLEDKEGPFTVDQERAERVQMALDYVQKRIPEFTTPPHIGSEIKVDPGSEQYPGWKGTADIILYNESELEVIDYKGGFGEVQPDSYQNLSYMQGALRMLYPDRAPAKLRSTIIQPKNGGVKSVQIADIQTFDSIIYPLLGALQVSLDPNAPRCPSESACRYCTGTKEGRCQEYTDWRTENLQKVFAKVPAPASAVQPMGMPASIKDYSPEVLRQIADAAPIVRQWLTECEAEGIERFRRGDPIPDYKVVRGRPTVKWALGEADTAKKLGNMHLSKKLWTKETLRTPLQVMKLPEVKDWSEQKQGNLEKLTKKVPGGLKLVPSTDKGEAVTFDPVEIFKEIPPPQEPAAEQQTEPQPAPAEKSEPISFL